MSTRRKVERENNDCIVYECDMNKYTESLLVSRNHCDTSGDPAKTVPVKRRVPNKRREEFKTQRFHGPNVNMSEVKTLQEKIEGKLKMLKFTAEDTEKILESEDVKAIERHGSALESITDKTHQLKLQVQELRFENNDDLTEIRSRSENLEAQIDKFEVSLKQVKCVAADIKSAKEKKREEEKRKRIMDEEIELEKVKFQARAKLEKSAKTSLEDSENSSSVGANYRSLRHQSFKEPFLTGQGFGINSKLKSTKPSLLK